MIQVQRGDISLRPLEREKCEDCEVREATHFISFDIRACGMERGFGFYCEACGQERVDDIRATLPADTDDGTVPS